MDQVLITFILTGPSRLDVFLGTALLPASTAACPVMWKVAVPLALVSKSLRPYKAGPDHRFCTSFTLYTTHFAYKSFLAKIFGLQLSWYFK